MNIIDMTEVRYEQDDPQECGVCRGVFQHSPTCPEQCACYEFVGDNPKCPKHGDIYRENEGKKESNNDSRRKES